VTRKASCFCFSIVFVLRCEFFSALEGEESAIVQDESVKFVEKVHNRLIYDVVLLTHPRPSRHEAPIISALSRNVFFFYYGFVASALITAIAIRGSSRPFGGRRVLLLIEAIAR
jgi:hypothetical protein